ncbi:204_t:CDS:2, partial [Racocetra fulgida]
GKETPGIQVHTGNGVQQGVWFNSKAQSNINNENVTTFENKNNYHKEPKEHNKLNQSEESSGNENNYGKGPKEHVELNQSEVSDNESEDFHSANDDNIIEITFHVHMPQFFDKSMQPLVIGSVEELGRWKIPKAKLHQIENNSTYWVSDPIKIFHRDLDHIKYKYAFYRPKEPQHQEFLSSISSIYDALFGDSTIVME